MTNTQTILIPVENQVRELDPKLLLSVCAANAGLKSYIGYRTEMDIMITKFPRSIYLAKSFTQRSDKMFRILSKLGHTICAWDEEALVHYVPDIYFKRRLSATALSYVSYLFAWGQENKDLFEEYPLLPKDLTIYKVGNPRIDLLRKEFKNYYEDEINKIKNQHGDFILINTNFGNVNAHLNIHNLFTTKKKDGSYGEMGRGSLGMGREFAEGRAIFKQTIFSQFLELIPQIANEFKHIKIVIRPHPVENTDPYHKIASKYDNVEVIQKGNVIPWIRAATALIHSGCTTGIEAYLSNKTAIAFSPTTHPRYGYCSKIPDQLSNQCGSIPQVIDMLHRYIRSDQPTIDSSVLDKYIEYDADNLCCTNIVNTLLNVKNNDTHNSTSIQKLHGSLLATKRKWTKRIKGLSPNSKYNKAYQNVRFPELNEKDLQAKIDRFSSVLNTRSSIKIKQVSAHIFLVQ
ncbi:MAG: surface carbohydrate biosynthesis protein [Gammaproteobacteria bacterium]